MNLTWWWTRLRIRFRHDCPRCFARQVRTREGWFCPDCFLGRRDDGHPPLPAPPPKDAA